PPPLSRQRAARRGTRPAAGRRDQPALAGLSAGGAGGRRRPPAARRRPPRPDSRTAADVVVAVGAAPGARRPAGAGRPRPPPRAGGAAGAPARRPAGGVRGDHADVPQPPGGVAPPGRGGAMQYRVTHTTTYEYSAPVSLCHNVVHLTPRE